MIFSMMATSSTVRAIGPRWSSVQLMGTTPYLLTRPKVGLMPTTPLVLAGLRIDPDVSPPVAAISMDEASADPEPPLDPPELRARSHGLWQPGVTPPNENSGRFVFP